MAIFADGDPPSDPATSRAKATQELVLAWKQLEKLRQLSDNLSEDNLTNRGYASSGSPKGSMAPPTRRFGYPGNSKPCHHSAKDLARKLRRYINAYSANAKPIQGKYSDPTRRIRSNVVSATCR